MYSYMPYTINQTIKHACIMCVVGILLAVALALLLLSGGEGCVLPLRLPRLGTASRVDAFALQVQVDVGV